MLDFVILELINPLKCINFFLDKWLVHFIEKREYTYNGKHMFG